MREEEGSKCAERASKWRRIQLYCELEIAISIAAPADAVAAAARPSLPKLVADLNCDQTIFGQELLRR